MMRINIIGTGFVDMADGGGLSFKRQNPQFRFCDVSFGRSVEFSIPATEKNRKMLGFADDPAQYGSMLRQSHDCQVIYDGGAFDATLNVTGYEGDTFKCVLLLDNAEWINALQDRKLADCESSWTTGVVWDSASQVFDADDPNIYTQPEGNVLVNYDNNLGLQPANWQLIPSVNIMSFLKDILTNLGVPSFTLDIPKEYWLVMGSVSGGTKETVTIAATSDTAVTVSANSHIEVWWERIRACMGYFMGIPVGSNWQNAGFFRAKQDVKITFPTTFPATQPVYLWRNKVEEGYELLGGGDKFESYAGRTVELKKGQAFFIPNTSTTYWYGFEHLAYPFTYNIIVESDADLAIGETWFIRNNMPDMTVFEFLKSVCLAIGRELIVDANGITVAYGSYGSTFVGVDDVISIDSVRRNVNAWGDNVGEAVVAFDSDDYVTEPIRLQFNIDNTQLDETKEWKSKFSEGNVGTDCVVIQDVEASGGDYKCVAKRCTIAYADGNESLLNRIPMPEPVGYADIAGDGTCVKMKLRKGEADFFRLSNDVALIWRGMAYVWTDADWNAGVLTLTLQKVSERR